MQVVKYEINNNSLTVGFKVDDFVVYSQIAYDKNKTKSRLLQQAYIQCKKAIEYEKTLEEHSFTSDEVGSIFVPEAPKPAKLKIDFNNLSGVVLDQYGDNYSSEVAFTIYGTDKAKIESGVIIEDVVEGDTEYHIVASYGSLTETEKRVIHPPEPDKVNELREEIYPSLERLSELNNQVVEIQNYIVEKEYQELLKEGGI